MTATSNVRTSESQHDASGSPGFDNRQSPQNARRNGIEPGKNQTVQIAEREPFLVIFVEARSADGAEPGSLPQATPEIETAQ